MSLRKSSKGIFIADICINGRRKKVSLKTANQKLARQIYHKFQTEAIEGRWFDRPQLHALEEMLMKAYPNRSFTAILEYFGKDTLITRITPQHLSEYKDNRSNKVSPASTNRDLAALKHAFNLAIREWEWCTSNPVSQVKFLKEPPGRDRWLTDEEEKRLMVVCPPWLRELGIFALNTGMRLSEILELTWKAVDLFRRTVTVIHSKNDLKRTIPLNDVVFDLLKAKTRVRSIKNDLVFPNRVGVLWDKTKIDKIFRRVLQKAGIEDFHFHDLRHTFASRLAQQSIDLYRIQRLLGHKSPSMTQRYSHLVTENLKESVQSLCPKNVPLKEIEIAESV